MPHEIRIVLEAGEIAATLNDSVTATAISDALPLEGTIRLWGEEIYFEVPIKLSEAEDARQDMAVGELGYWPVGTAFCIFFGPTPASSAQQPRAYSNVNPFGMVDGEQQAIKAFFQDAQDGQAIRILAISET